jgi:uncharacterized protein YndB with AHSA1/START domain
MTEPRTRMTTARTFTVERAFDHPLSLVYGAFTDLEAKKIWYGGQGDWEVTKHTLDFRVGGWELWRGRPHANAPWMTNEALIYDILPEERLITGYTMTMDGKLFTVSQQVLEFSATPVGAHIKLTEQILYIDAVDHHENRVEGTQGMLLKLDNYLVAQQA